MWNNSSTLKILVDNKEYSLLEFQFHTKSRQNMAIRWVYENFLTIFKDKLYIVELQIDIGIYNRKTIINP